MLGLGTGIVKGGVGAKTIVTDNLVLKHDYPRGKVHQVSTGAAFFDGTDDYIDVGDSDGIITGTNVTMACWFRLLDGDDTYLMTNKRTSGSSNLAIRVNLTSGGANDGHVSFVIWDGSSSHGDVSYDGNVDTSNKWHHVAVTTTSSAQKLYLDGVEVASGSNTFGNAASSDHMLLGNGPGSYFLKGYMCNAAVWNRVLTQAEVKSIMWKNYADLTSAETTSLSSWWNLDSTIDSVNAATLVYDNHHSGGDTLGSELVPTPYVLGSSNGEWVAYNHPSGTTGLATDGSILTVTLSGGGNSVASGAKMEISGSITAGKTYKVQADIWLGTSTETSGFSFYLGGVAKSISSISSTQTTYTAYITTTGTGDLLIYQTDVDSDTGTFFISNVSVQLVNGNTGTLS